MLERAGYDAVTAPGPVQALEMVTSKASFDLVVSDVVMPTMCGPELVDKIRMLSPSSAVMLMSGYVPAEQVPKAACFLSKPFSPRELTDAVQKALETAPG